MCVPSWDKSFENSFIEPSRLCLTGGHCSNGHDTENQENENAFLETEKRGGFKVKHHCKISEPICLSSSFS